MLNSGWASITVSPWPQAPWFLEDLGMSQHDSPHFGMDKYKTWACLKTYETLSKTIVWADESLQNPSYFSVNMCVCVNVNRRVMIGFWPTIQVAYPLIHSSLGTICDQAIQGSLRYY